MPTLLAIVEKVLLKAGSHLFIAVNVCGESSFELNIGDASPNVQAPLERVQTATDPFVPVNRVRVDPAQIRCRLCYRRQRHLLQGLVAQCGTFVLNIKYQHHLEQLQRYQTTYPSSFNIRQLSILSD